MARLNTNEPNGLANHAFDRSMIFKAMGVAVVLAVGVFLILGLMS